MKEPSHFLTINAQNWLKLDKNDTNVYMYATRLLAGVKMKWPPDHGQWTDSRIKRAKFFVVKQKTKI